MGTGTKHTLITSVPKLRKLSPATPKTKAGKKSTTSSLESLKSRPTSQTSARRQWCSHVPRSQHAWQVATKTTANGETGTELQRIYSLLSQLHRRNKNQHRGQKWWKFFHLLRREVGLLVRIEGELETVGKTVDGEGSEGVRERLARGDELRVKKAKVEGWVRDVLMGRLYAGFSTVVRESQFAALGVVLLGVLASVGREVGLPEVQVERIVGVSVRRTGVDVGEVVRRDYSSPRVKDEGEVVERPRKEDEMEDQDMKSVETQMGSTSSAMASSQSPGKGKKKKGKKSTIDDLFAGLV